MANNYATISMALTAPSEEAAEWLANKLLAPDALDEDGDEVLLNWSVETNGLDVYIYDEEYADIDQLATILQEYLQLHDPGGCVGIECAYTCSKPRTDEFGGQAVFITATNMEWMGTSSWIHAMKQAFLLNKTKEES